MGMGSISFSVVVHVINVEGVMVGKSENDPPVCANRRRPKTFLSTFQRVQPQTRHVHIGNGPNSVKPRETMTPRG